MINPNHREDTQVAAGLGNRGRSREELPLSTRVHELAKELGLKSQELLERIQKWGLDVKASPLASLDPPMVDRIRELMDQSGAGDDSTSAARPHRPAPPSPVASVASRRDITRGRRRAASLTARRPYRSWSCCGDFDARRGRSWRETARPPRRSRRRPRPAAPQRLIPGSSPSAPARPAGASAPAAHVSAMPPGGRPAPSAPAAPLSRPGGFSGTRPAGGPLSAHTTHRGVAPRPGGPAHPAPGPRPESRPGQPSSHAPAPPGSAPAGFQPLKRDDYMSSAGTRPMTPRVGPSSPSSAGPRRPVGESGGDAGRRETNRGADRPLPKVAAPTSQAPRGNVPQRSAPSAAIPKTQRPERSVTREEMLALMKSGGLNAFPAPGGQGGPAGGSRGGQPQRGAAGPSTGQPRGGPALGAGTIARRPAPDPECRRRQLPR